MAVARLVYNADCRTVADLSRELYNTRHESDERRNAQQRWLERLARVPGVIPGLHGVLGRSGRGRKLSGTVLVTAVGMFAGGAGFAIAHQVSIRSPSWWARSAPDLGCTTASSANGELLDITVSVDHRGVDGAPATRFAADLRRLLEEGLVFDQPA